MTKRRTTKNFKLKINQNWQKIELYGSPTTKELRKKHSSKLVGGVETGSQGGEDAQQGSNGARQQMAVPHFSADKPGATTQERAPRGPAQETKTSKPLAIETCEDCGGRRNFWPHKRVH